VTPVRNRQRKNGFTERKGVRLGPKGRSVFKSNTGVNLLSNSLVDGLARLYIPHSFSAKIIKKRTGFKGYNEVG